jgi:hypothetical protein
MAWFDLFRIPQRHGPLPVAVLVSHDRIFDAPVFHWPTYLLRQISYHEPRHDGRYCSLSERNGQRCFEKKPAPKGAIASGRVQEVISARFQKALRPDDSSEIGVGNICGFVI